MTVSGDLHCKGEIRVNGRVFGDIVAKEIYVGEGALIEGSVVADLVTIHGSIGGAVKAPVVSIGKSARVVGTITHHTLSIEPGAIVEGRAPWRPRPDWEKND